MFDTLIGNQVMLLLITTTFSRCFLVTSSCKGTITVYGLNKLDFKTQGSTKFITLRPLVAPSLRSGAAAQGLRVINSVDPCVLKSNYYIATCELATGVLISN